jgi:uncharacterized protein DUF222
MYEKLRDAIALVRDAVASMSIRESDGRDAVRFFDAFAELERLASAGRTIAGRRVEQTRAWYGSSFPNPAAWMAARSQVTLGSAVAMLETGRRLDELPATRQAFVAGALSAQQAQEITTAAAADPSAETSLLDAAGEDSVSSLRQQCRQVVAAASRDRDADERMHRSRSLRFWTDADGMRRLDGRLAPEASAPLEAVIEARSRELLEAARAAGSREKREAYAADALVGLADSSTPGPKAVVNVNIDFDAWVRGHLEPGEECSIVGIGPVSVEAARRLAGNGYINAVLKDDADVRAISSVGRPIPARLRAALEARDVTCVVPGCDVHKNLEIHHIVPVCDGGLTCMQNCCRLCHWHHILVSRGHWRIDGGPGDWQWVKLARRVPPDDP